MAIYGELGSIIILGVVAFCTVVALVIFIIYRCSKKARIFYNFLEKNYSDRLKTLGITESNFPLNNIGVTNPGILYQFKILETFKGFNQNDQVLLAFVEDLKSILKKALWLIFGSLGVFVVGLLVYYLL